MVQPGQRSTLIRVGAASPQEIETTRNRLMVMMIVFVVGFAVISLRVLEVAFIGGGEIKDGLHLASQERPFKRADIVDRNGVLLASSLATASLYANPRLVLDVDDAVNKLATVFPQLERSMLERRLSSHRQFVWLKRNLTPTEQHETNQLGIPGLFFRREEKRVYPHENLLSHVLGFVNVDGHGLMGAEKYFDQRLLDPEINTPLALSIDVRVQSIVYEALLEQTARYNALGAVAVVMDVDNGELLSLVSLPDFSPNVPGSATDAQTFNRATLGVYEMGSTFKVFNTAMGFEKGDVAMEDHYDVSKPIRVGGFTIRDFHPKKGTLTVPEILMYSSNIGSARMAVEVGAVQQRHFLQKLGLLSPLDVQLPEKATPLFPSNWGKVSTMTISYGHGIAVTPIHVAKATAALVNGGTLYPATLLPDDHNRAITPNNVVSEATSDALRKLLRLTVEFGTGGAADAEHYLVGGKTGSADKVSSDGTYRDSGTISSFVSVFPMHKPRYVILVMLDEPKSAYGSVTGGVVAAPVAKEIISKIGPVLGVPPVDRQQYEIRQEFWYDNDNEADEPKLATVDTF